MSQYMGDHDGGGAAKKMDNVPYHSVEAKVMYSQLSNSKC